MDDIPSVLDVLKKRFKESVEKDGKLSKIRSKIQSGKNVSYKDAEDYAYRSGQLLSNTLKSGMTEEMFDQQDDFREMITPLLKQNYDYVSNATGMVQETLNHDANIGMKAILPEFDEGMANGISNKIASYDSFEDAEWLLGDPIVSNSQGIVDDTLKANADFQYQSGMRPKVIRIAESGCCEWCASLEGEYYYPDVPEEVWQRHANCQCEVIYDPGDGRRQNVHTKEWSFNSDDYKERINKEHPSLMFRSRAQKGGKEFAVKYERDVANQPKAEKTYEAIRLNPNDIVTISKNTEFSVKEIEQIKNHIFFDVHLLYDEEGRFSADYDMAVAWKRLERGDYLERDLILLKHELLEAVVEKKYNLTASEAHKIAKSKYDWESILDKETNGEGEKDGLL